MANIDIVERAGKLLWETAAAPSKVILFGSHARGESRIDSDLDLLVIERELSSQRAERLKLRRALRGLGVPVDLIVVSEQQVAKWGNVEGTMLHAALTEGRVLAE